jgi:acyl-CoA synthetase (AMP-forming)/AMP-acid ligase II
LLTTFVFEGMTAWADKPALVEGSTGRAITYEALVEAVRRLAGGLRQTGFGPGQVLAIMAPNMPEYAVAFHGAALAGGTVTTINPTYTGREIHQQLEDSGATILLAAPISLENGTAGAEGTAVRRIAVMGDGVDNAPSLEDLMGEPFFGDAGVDADDVAALPYSSGTTGLAKGVMLTHRNLVANIVQTISALEMRGDDTLIAVLPFFHIYGMQVLMNCALRVGATVVTMPRFDLEQFLQLHKDYEVTRSFVAPPMIVALAKHPVVDSYDLSSLVQVLSGAAPLSAELARETARRIDCEVVQGYGLTETAPVTHVTPPGRCKPGSVGLAVPNTETLIVDPSTGHSLSMGQDGEIWVRGPQVMKGYLNNPSATAATLDGDGWLHTGDIGHFDEDEHLFVVDRLKELIKYKGFQVPPAELEALLLTHPAVADAGVIGVADDEAGEVPVGFIVCKHGQEVTEEAIMEFVAGQVASYKQIRSVIFVDHVPKSGSGKILRRVLRDTVAEGTSRGPAAIARSHVGG